MVRRHLIIRRERFSLPVSLGYFRTLRRESAGRIIRGRKIVTMVGVAWLTLANGATEAPDVFFGEIADSQCALNVHSLTRSHQEMLKSKSMGGTSASCATYCIKYLGGDFVLAAKKDVYRLDDQERAAKFAGEKVKVTGVLQSKKGTIHIVSIELEDRPVPSGPGT